MNHIQYESLKDGDTDKNMTLLTIESDGEVEALYNWFAVHPVAMNKSNTLINGDVKGWASHIIETDFKKVSLQG